MKRDIATESIRYVENKNGPELGYSALSGVKILEKDGLFFKNLSRTGVLQPWEDWRLSAKERAEDLARQLTPRQIAGLMMNGGYMEFPPDPADPDAPAMWELSDRYKALYRDLGVRHHIVGYIDTPEAMARYTNNRQAFIEGLDLPIPLDICSDPRHGSDNTSEFNQGAGTGVSPWTEMLGLAATFDPELVRTHGEIAAREYRALGITTALSPQIDLATEPRWSRVKGTFGEGAKLSRDMAKAYIDGFQTSAGDREVENGWGLDSVAAICKHWPGGGTGEGGRDAHNAEGKYAVYPGNNFEAQLEPFVDGALKLDGKTEKTAGMMPYYTISYQQDPSGKNVANAYSPYIIRDLLREKYGYDGMVCTDWEIVKLPESRKHLNFGIFWEKRCWGLEDLSPQEQYYQLLMNTVDQFGGDNDVETLYEGYELVCQRHGKETADALMHASAVRILTSMFRLGLFENPYLKIEESQKIVNCEEFRNAGYAAQVKSAVLLKNRNHVLPLRPGTKVYIPTRHVAETVNWKGETVAAHDEETVNREAVQKVFEVVSRPEEADAAIVFLCSPQTAMSGPKPMPGAVPDGSVKTEYNPITLQYRPYTAEYARKISVAGDDPNGTGPNRSYYGKTVRCANENDLDMLLAAREVMGEKPVIAVMKCANPCVVAEFEPQADGILAHFDIHTKAILSLLCGKEEPSGLLPMQFPANMKTVEEQCEDVPFDMECHVDTEGHVYDYAFGMNWSGVIRDERVQKYGRH